MKVNRNKILIPLSVFGIAVGLGLCFLHLHRSSMKKLSHSTQLQPQESYINIRVEKVDPNSSIDNKLKNTYVSGNWQNCTLGKVCWELCNRAAVEWHIRSDVLYEIRKITVNDSVDHMPLGEVLIRILERHGLRGFVSYYGITIMWSGSSACQYRMPNGEWEWEVELTLENLQPNAPAGQAEPRVN